MESEKRRECGVRYSLLEVIRNNNNSMSSERQTQRVSHKSNEPEHGSYILRLASLASITQAAQPLHTHTVTQPHISPARQKSSNCAPASLRAIQHNIVNVVDIKDDCSSRIMYTYSCTRRLCCVSFRLYCSIAPNALLCIYYTYIF